MQNINLLITPPVENIDMTFVLTIFNLLASWAFTIYKVVNSAADPASDATLLSLQDLSSGFLPQIAHYCNNFMGINSVTICRLNESTQYLADIHMAGWRAMMLQLSSIIDTHISVIDKLSAMKDSKVADLWEKWLDSNTLVNGLFYHICVLKGIEKGQDTENLLKNLRKVRKGLSGAQDVIVRSKS